MKLDASKIRKILVISLSNIGDCVLTFPVIDILKEQFPQSELDLVVGPKAEGLFKGNPHFAKVHVFDKHQSALNQLRWVFNLWQERFDLAVDLRHTAIPFLIGAKYRTPLIRYSAHIPLPLWEGQGEGTHKRVHHLARLKTIVDFKKESKNRFCLCANAEDEEYVSRLLKHRIGYGKKVVVMSPGAADQSKRWPEENFATLADWLVETKQVKIVFVGDNSDAAIIRRILGKMKNSAIDLSGQITLIQLAQLLKKTSLVIANDSAVMHMASYLDVPVVALFGPTNPEVYGPWSRQSTALRNNSTCPACREPNSSARHMCMSEIQAGEVFKKIQLLSNGILKV